MAEVGHDLRVGRRAAWRGRRGGCRGCRARRRSAPAARRGRGRLARRRSRPAGSRGRRRSPPTARSRRGCARTVSTGRCISLRKSLVGQGRRAKPTTRRLGRQQAGTPQVVERGQDLAVGEVAGGAEDDHDTGRRDASRGAVPMRSGLASAFRLAPGGRRGPAPAARGPRLVVPGAVRAPRLAGPRRLRRDACVLGGHAATRSSRRARRTGCAARRAPWPCSSRPAGCGSAPAATSVMTGAGTSWSIASWTVQRPSPESATQPLMSARSVPFCSKARPASSSSHERMTVPCFHALAIASRSSGYSDACMISKPSA